MLFNNPNTNPQIKLYSTHPGVDKVWPPQMAPPYGPHNGPPVAPPNGPHNGPPWKNDNIR